MQTFATCHAKRPTHADVDGKRLCNTCYKRMMYRRKVEAENKQRFEKISNVLVLKKAERIVIYGEAEERKREAWSKSLQQRYKLTAEQYISLFKAQDGKCAICHTYPKRRRLAVDHNHKTGLVRGLCCFKCNYLMGILEKNVGRWEKMKKYLESPPAVQVIGNVGLRVGELRKTD